MRLLFKEQVPADPRLVRQSVERVENGLAISLKGLITDRGFDNKTNVAWLEERGIFAGLCPRDPRALREAMKDEDFAQAQHRRAQIEARIAIFKNEFLGRPMRSVVDPPLFTSPPYPPGLSYIQPLAILKARHMIYLDTH